MTSTFNWSDLDPAEAPRIHAFEPDSTHAALAVDCAQCFGTAAGQRILGHLRSITVNRTLGPAAPDALLRYVEGQRQLVSYICALVERGRTSPSSLAQDASDPALSGAEE